MPGIEQVEQQFIYKNHKKLRYGYTTGSCAAAAAKAAAEMLLTQCEVAYVELMTPKGVKLNLEVLDIKRNTLEVSCAIRKDGGDDPDQTHGMLIYARVMTEAFFEWKGIEQKQSFLKENQLWKEYEADVEGPVQVILAGGPGVGRVTKPGLEQRVGSPAINRVPRQMIRCELQELCQKHDYTGNIYVCIYAPEGKEKASRTFNPRLGITGGISILGTSGIVEPMSEQALVDTIRAEMKMKLSGQAGFLIVSPGNYGADFAKEQFDIDLEEAVKCSNFIGEMIDSAVEFGAKEILLIGHIGKLVKVAGGIMNTHSRCADSRMEILAANGILAGADGDIAREIMECVTTDEAVSVLLRHGLQKDTMNLIVEKIIYYLNHRAASLLSVGVVIFSNEHGLLGMSQDAERMLNHISAKERSL